MNKVFGFLQSILWIVFAILIGAGIKRGRSDYRNRTGSEPARFDLGSFLGKLTEAGGEATDSFGSARSVGAAPKRIMRLGGEQASRPEAARKAAFPGQEPAKKGSLLKLKTPGKAKPYGLMELEDREHDWLAGQLREERRIAKRGVFASMNGGERGAARLNKQLHEADCDADAVKVSSRSLFKR